MGGLAGEYHAGDAGGANAAGAVRRLDIGESMVETLTFRVQTDLINQEEAVPLRFTREGFNEVRVTHAEPMALDGNALMANSTVRTVLSMLGYQQIDEHVPVTLNALLVNR